MQRVLNTMRNSKEIIVQEERRPGYEPLTPATFQQPTPEQYAEATGPLFEAHMSARNEATEQERLSAFKNFESNSPAIKAEDQTAIREQGIKWVQKLTRDMMASAITINNLDLSLLQAARSLPQPESAPEVPCTPTVPNTESKIWNDKHGIPAAIIVRNGAKERHRSDPHYIDFNSRLIKRIDDFEKVYPVQQPPQGSNDSRHPHDDYTEAERQYFQERGIGAGRLHLGTWIPKGHDNDAHFEHGVRWNHVQTEDTRGGRSGDKATRQVRADAAEEFLACEDVVDLEVTAGAIYEVIDLINWAEARSNRKRMVEAGLLKEHDDMQCFNLTILVSNRTVKPHRDNSKAKELMAIWTTAGKYVGGDICLPEYDIRLQILPGDIFLCRAALLVHAVTSFVGTRYCILFSTKFLHLVENIRDMPDGPARQALIAEKKKKDIKGEEKQVKRESYELGLITEYLNKIESGSLEPDFEATDVKKKALHDVPSNSRRLGKALAEKTRCLKQVPEEDSEARNAIEKKPASLFY